jgi:ribosomal protein S18 acetylase RimI-like enzyme
VSRLERIELEGAAYRAAATELLLVARAEDSMAGLYEAADLQWWSVEEDDLQALQTTFWRDRADGWAACLLVADDGETLAADLLWRPSCCSTVRGRVIGPALVELATMARSRNRPVDILARDDDGDYAQRLAVTGFARRPEGDIVQTVRGTTASDANRSLPSGLRLIDATAGRGPFPRIARRSAAAASVLRSCTLYRAGLDLAIVTDDGEIAAHALCWLDAGNGIGLFEPLRTEDAFQRRGFARRLMAEGIARMTAAGARLIKVSHRAGNMPARALYLGSGFQPAFTKHCYRFEPGR